jgi:hypothetical protein
MPPFKLVPCWAGGGRANGIAPAHKLILVCFNSAGLPFDVFWIKELRGLTLVSQAMTE